jgi:hypothetical protein
MENRAFKKVYSIIKNKLQEEMMASGAPTNSTNPPGQVNIAGLSPDSPPVDLRKKKERKWNPFFKDLARVQRREK